MNYLSSVASRTIRRAFWLLSIGLQTWRENSVAISHSASAFFGKCDLNCLLQDSQMPIAGVGEILTILSLRFGTTEV